MSQASHLAQLQKFDTQLDHIQSRLLEIEQVLKSNQALQQAENDTHAAKERLLQAQRTLRSAEERVQAQRIKIETSEASLYSGKIHSPKELQDLQTEIVSLKKRLAALEDEQLEGMVALEQAEDDQKKADQRLVLVQAELASQSASLLGEQSLLRKNQERFQTEKQAVLPQISAENLQTYNRLREQKRGMAVSQVEDGACKSCGTALRPAEIQAARSPSQLARCSTCGRILYAG